MPRLLLNFGTPQQCEFLLKPGPNSLGRAADNDFSIDHHSISGAHCQILVGDDVVSIRDLGSTNGTFVDLVPIQGARLQSGQTLRLGDVELLFDADTIADPPPTTFSATLIEPEPPPITPVAPISSGPPKCNSHSRYVAKFQCHGCGGFFCDLCVATKRIAGIQQKHCRACNLECQPVNPLLLIERTPDDDKTFFQLLPKAFKFPFQGDGWILMVTGTLFYLFVSFIAHARTFGASGLIGLLILSVFAFGYLFAYMAQIIVSTSNGARQMPDWPDFGSWEDVLIPLLHMIVLLLCCFSPVLLIAGVALSAPWALNLILPAFLLGCLYLPMATLAVAMFDSVTALNPLLIIPSIIQVCREYLVACGVLFLILLLQGIINFAMNKLSSPYLPGVICGFLGWYFLTVEMRILGLLHRTKKHELGWFKF
jgi:hypothetical protein